MENQEIQKHPRLHPKIKFSQSEDLFLTSLVQRYGEKDFEEIASYMPNRNSRQCRDRWINYLSPSVCRNPWTDEDDIRLNQLYEQIGPKWVKIGHEMGRTDTCVKNRFLVLTRRQKKLERKALGIKSHHKRKASPPSPVAASPSRDENEPLYQPHIFEQASNDVFDLNNDVWQTPDPFFNLDVFSYDMF